ncbi:MAG: hypothetical protein Q3997_06165 [Propionibacteriaceae bacterium]|nr:hypothetical protein [Propionibacteriaceae bacterium]
MSEPSSRAEDARRRLELAEAAARAESEAAQKLIDAFVADARAAGLPSVPLRATLLDGTPVKTDKRGWYLRVNRSIAVGEDGGYYVLTVPGGLMERLRGAKLKASPPPMFIGKGGRDGETGDLAFFLGRALRGEV